MDKKDKEAFEKWFISCRDSLFATFLRENHPDVGIKWEREPTRIAWQAACAYKNKEYSDICDARMQTSLNNVKLEAENAKLRECVEFYADYKNDDPDNDYNNEYAIQILKELEGEK